ncbi:MAG: response regulator [Methylococcales bacterium]|nr:response regulator [Methylococcales bacterium]
MKPLSILIVDDNIAARKLLRSVLAGIDQRTMISEATSGAEAIRHIKISLCNIVFLDIEMPDKNGLEVLKEILVEVPDQFVVMVSANATIVNVKKSVELGGKGFIVKPYAGEKVKAALARYLLIKTQA